MKKSFLVLLSLTFPLFSFGQSGDAKEIIDQLTSKYESMESFRAEFTYEIYDPGMEEAEINKGELTVKGDGYLLNIPGQQVICNGETIWTYLVDAEEVQINSVEEDNGTITPSSILTFYNDNYKSKVISGENEEIQVIELKPDEHKKVSRVELFVNTDEMIIKRIHIFDNNEGSVNYIINNFYPDFKINDSKFIFNEEEYPGVEIIDMR